MGLNMKTKTYKTLKEKAKEKNLWLLKGRDFLCTTPQGGSI